MGDHRQTNHNTNLIPDNLIPDNLIPDNLIPDNLMPEIPLAQNSIPEGRQTGEPINFTASGSASDRSQNAVTSTPADLTAIASLVNTTAQNRQGDPIQLLALLRLLEALHREIRDGLFQAALPDNRQSLYALLKDIEAEGGWPYIYRRRLTDLLSHALGVPQPTEGDRNQKDS